MKTENGKRKVSPNKVKCGGTFKTFSAYFRNRTKYIFPQFRVLMLVCLCLSAYLLPTTVFAQDEIPSDVAAAPEKILSEVEKKALEIKDVKKRTKLSIELMETRLRTAEMLVQIPKFQDALKEIGAYQGLLEDSFKFLEQNDLKSEKVQDNFRNLELVLRKQMTRLELIRREMSYKYGWHVQKLMKFVREVRAKAVEPLFSDTVVPENKPI
jgi:hypothetical protein